MSRALARHLTPVTADRLIAAGLALWALFDVPWWWRPPGHGGSNLTIAGMVALAAAQSVPFLRRRQLPPVVLAVTAVALAVKFAAHLNLWSATGAVLTAAYGLGAYGTRTLRVAVRVMVALAVLAAIVTLQVIEGNHTTAIGCALFATALAVGEITAAHRDLVTSLARQAYDEERASLAREVHDVVAHQLSAIAVQAGAARLAAAEDPQAAVTAISRIELGARHGLDELNALVRRMRLAETGSAAPPDLAARGPDTPQPRLHDVPALVERARQAGLRADLTVDGEARPLTDAIELAGYRVVQEGLTNAIRHAAGAAATVRLWYNDTGILIEVADEGPSGTPAAHAHAANGGGAGLVGLSERATLLGGEFEAGRREDGFLVRAFLPSRA
ncbi:MAG TPA: histidine kinase [Streptosporangiaceae bacterium]|nr:histidine kinase [Streptosporangiaceae bacterium]